MRIGGLVLVLVRFVAAAFDLENYYSQRFILSGNRNFSEFLVAAQSKEDAFELFSTLSANCTYPTDPEVTELNCNDTDTDFCRENKGEWRQFKYSKEGCECEVETSCQAENLTDLVLYPGCSCQPAVDQCDLNGLCPHWQKYSDHEDLEFNVSIPKKLIQFKSIITAGFINKTFDRKRVSFISSNFRQSGFNCTLLFTHYFTPQSLSSRLFVRAILANGEVKILYEFAKETVKTRWTDASVRIGSFSQPFRISIDCETGSKPIQQNSTKKVAGTLFACGLTKIRFDDCVDIRNPVERCSRGNSFLCSTPDNTKCLRDAECDLRPDCSDGSDEMDCAHMVTGSMCDFNDKNIICEGWQQLTRIAEGPKIQIGPTTPAPVNKKMEPTLINLLQIRTPPSEVSIPRGPRTGSGSMLSYESMDGRELTRRISVLFSPEFPRTNPEAYVEESRFFGTCKIRFFLCSTTDTIAWHISIISKSINPFDSGKIVLLDTRQYDRFYGRQATTCEWKRILVNIPRQNDGFRLGIFVEHEGDHHDFLGIDDFSLSPTCFEKDGNHTSWENRNLLISSCGSSGLEKPKNCDEYRARDGQTGHFTNEDGSQEWTVPRAGFYRIEACGAGGGSSGLRSGKKGECVKFQVHLVENIALRMLIGQMGESACVAEQYGEIRASSCSKISENRRDVRKGGGGGGGATLITVESSIWNVVVGGGGGASGVDPTSKVIDNNVGYGTSIVPPEVDQQCGEICREVSHEDFTTERNHDQCPEEDETVFGGFGGGGNTCGLLGGGGAGYRSGNPFGKGRQRSGSSNVTDHFAKRVMYYQAQRVDDGFIKISFCHKQCPFPSVCRFRIKDDNLDEEFCGCPDGSDFTNTTESCVCSLDCPFASTCQYRNFTYEPFCLCNNGKFIDDISNDVCEESQRWMWYNYLFLVFVLITVISAFVVVFYYRNRTNKMKQELFDLTQFKSSEYTYDDIYFGRKTRQAALDSLPSVDRDMIKLGRVLGKGNFGEVLYGEYHGQKLAVKTISKPFCASLSAQADFCNEALCMGTFVHDNVVRLVGIDFEQLPYFIAIEYMEGGDLLSFVKDSRPNKISLNPFQLTMSDLVKISCDVAAGCKCLETYGYVHRDIAARNILLSSRGPKRVAKIADFGMAKEITYGSEYYRVHGRAVLPIKWTPPEAFIDGVFTTKSDVWSFGILCWEVFSLGVVPYPNRRNEEVMLMLTDGGRLEYPYGIPTRVYQLMRMCWRTSPDDRPTFIEVVDTLEDILHDALSVGMPFPIHPTVRASYAHAQSTPVSVETPKTATTDISLNSGFNDVKVYNAQQDIQDRINLHEMMLTREQPYSSEMTACVVDNLRKDLARAQYESGTATVPQPEYLSPDSIDETIKLIPNGRVITDHTPPSSLVDLNRLGVQNTGPLLHRPDSLNINDYYSSVPLLECQTR